MSHKLLDVYHEHRESLRAYLQKRLRDPELASDLLQDIFVKIQAISASQNIQYPKAFMYRMANNLAIDHMRRKAKRNANIVQLEDAHLYANNIDPEQNANYGQQLEIIAQALDTLPLKTKEAFLQCRLHEYDKKTVAKNLGVSVNMIEKHLRHAVEHFKNKINDP